MIIVALYSIMNLISEIDKQVKCLPSNECFPIVAEV